MLVVGTRERRDRLNQLVNLLGADVTTADRLARRLRCSVRTVYRDIGALRQQGKPIIGEAGMGYVLRRWEASDDN